MSRAKPDRHQTNLGPQQTDSITADEQHGTRYCLHPRPGGPPRRTTNSASKHEPSTSKHETTGPPRQAWTIDPASKYPSPHHHKPSQPAQVHDATMGRVSQGGSPPRPAKTHLTRGQRFPDLSSRTLPRGGGPKPASGASHPRISHPGNREQSNHLIGGIANQRVHREPPRAVDCKASPGQAPKPALPRIPNQASTPALRRMPIYRWAPRPFVHDGRCSTPPEA